MNDWETGRYKIRARYSKDSEEIVEINKETTLITDGSEVKEENKKRRKTKKIKDVSNIEEEK